MATQQAEILGTVLNYRPRSKDSMNAKGEWKIFTTLLFPFIQYEQFCTVRLTMLTPELLLSIMPSFFFSKDHYHAIMVLQTAGHSSAHCTPRHADRSPCFPATEARLYQTPLLTKKDARFCVTSTRFCQIVTAPCSCSLVLRGGNQGSGWVLTVTGTA